MNDLIERIRKAAKEDGRYKLDAYLFVFEALDYTVNKVVKEKRHVTGKELLDGIKIHAWEQFGPLAKMVFNTWGVYRTDDFGEIVFNLVSRNLMGKTESDSRDDFKSVYDFDVVFNFGQLPDSRTEKKKKSG
jgi:uncharacterized repeat protein (TIGR04138 family)